MIVQIRRNCDVLWKTKHKNGVQRLIPVYKYGEVLHGMQWKRRVNGDRRCGKLNDNNIKSVWRNDNLNLMKCIRSTFSEQCIFQSKEGLGCSCCSRPEVVEKLKQSPRDRLKKYNKYKNKKGTNKKQNELMLWRENVYLFLFANKQHKKLLRSLFASPCWLSYCY